MRQVFRFRLRFRQTTNGIHIRPLNSPNSIRTLVGDYFWYSGTIYENIKISPAAYIQPAAVVGYSAGTNKLRYTGGYTETRNNDALLYGVGVSVVGRNSPSGQVAFTPAFLFTKKVTIFSLDLDFIIETSH